jgi:hypothetical protein
MNSIRRPRRRCRVRSVNFKVFNWLLVHEGALRVLVEYHHPNNTAPWRAQIAHRTTETLRDRVERCLALAPKRGILP